MGSVTNLGCVLTGTGRPDQPYVATIRKVGIDLGITEQTALSWAVFVPVNYSGPGDLSGNYAGAQGTRRLVSVLARMFWLAVRKTPSPCSRSSLQGSRWD